MKPVVIRYLMIKRFLTLTLFVFIAFLFSFEVVQQPYENEFKSKRSIVRYTYELKRDSLLMVGKILRKKGKEPMDNTNIIIPQFRIGTVSNLEGEFKLYLPRNEGTILFDNVIFEKFEMEYSLSQKDLSEIRKLSGGSSDYVHH